MVLVKEYNNRISGQEHDQGGKFSEKDICMYVGYIAVIWCDFLSYSHNTASGYIQAQFFYSDF